MIEAASKLWNVWRHGAALMVINALGLAVGLFFFVIAGFAVNAVLLELGGGTDGDGLTSLLLVYLWPLWVPLGLGLAARYSSSDRHKPEGYPEHI